MASRPPRPRRGGAAAEGPAPGEEPPGAAGAEELRERLVGIQRRLAKEGVRTAGLEAALKEERGRSAELLTEVAAARAVPRARLSVPRGQGPGQVEEDVRLEELEQQAQELRRECRASAAELLAQEGLQEAAAERLRAAASGERRAAEAAEAAEAAGAAEAAVGAEEARAARRLAAELEGRGRRAEEARGEAQELAAALAAELAEALACGEAARASEHCTAERLAGLERGRLEALDAEAQCERSADAAVALARSACEEQVGEARERFASELAAQEQRIAASVASQCEGALAARLEELRERELGAEGRAREAEALREEARAGAAARGALEAELADSAARARALGAELAELPERRRAAEAAEGRARRAEGLLAEERARGERLAGALAAAEARAEALARAGEALEAEAAAAAAREREAEARRALLEGEVARLLAEGAGAGAGAPARGGAGAGAPEAAAEAADPADPADPALQRQLEEQARQLQQQAKALDEAHGMLQQLQAELDEARRELCRENSGRELHSSPSRGCADLAQEEELQRLLALAHEENGALREQLAQQAEEISLLEGRVLGALVDLRDEGGTASRWGARRAAGRAGSEPRPGAAKSPGPAGRATPPRRPGDIRRVLPPPKNGDKSGFVKIMGAV